MKKHFCLNLFFLLYLFFCAGCKQHISDSAAKANEALFTQLDSLIDNSDKLILQKEERIEALKHSLRQSKAFEKQYELNQAIYQEYRVYDADSEVLILGTLPSVKSRENHFYYGHKQNRFWKVLADLCGEPVPETIEEKKAMLLAHHIAIWDVIQSCDIKGSSDSSIRNVEPTDIRHMLTESKITGIYANGNKAGELYRKYQLPLTGKEATVLPSTSPANAAWSLQKLCEAWRNTIDITDKITYDNINDT
jgi:hypoxanthine-DNA glycosylase